jgi:hypothetical protein
MEMAVFPLSKPRPEAPGPETIVEEKSPIRESSGSAMKLKNAAKTAVF